MDYELTGKQLTLLLRTDAIARDLLDISRLSEEQIKELENQGSLCWECQYSLNNYCSWFKDSQPVCGWVAKSEPHPLGATYMVYDCPQFMRTIRVEKKFSGATAKEKEENRRLWLEKRFEVIRDLRSKGVFGKF